MIINTTQRVDAIKKERKKERKEGRKEKMALQVRNKRRGDEKERVCEPCCVRWWNIAGNKRGMFGAAELGATGCDEVRLFF